MKMEQALAKAVRASLCTITPSGSLDLMMRITEDKGKAISSGTG